MVKPCSTKPSPSWATTARRAAISGAAPLKARWRGADLQGVLRRVDNVQVHVKPDVVGLATGKYRVVLQVGRRELLGAQRHTRTEIRSWADTSQSKPVRYLTAGDKSYWRYQDRWHVDNDGLDADALRALLITRELRAAEALNRARTIAARGELPDGRHRQRIPNDLRLLVFQRDRGACVRCSCRTELQLDHIIPVAHGGGTTADNLEVLCGPCNRRKGASVA